MAKRAKIRSPAGREKVRQTMHEYRHGTLRSGSKSGPKVKSRRQAVAIALDQARREKRLKGAKV
jgi:hypothetical protein